MFIHFVTFRQVIELLRECTQNAERMCFGARKSRNNCKAARRLWSAVLTSRQGLSELLLYFFNGVIKHSVSTLTLGSFRAF